MCRFWGSRNSISTLKKSPEGNQVHKLTDKMADEATVMALNFREMHFLISRSLVLVYETNNFAFIRYLNKNGVIKSHLIVF